MLDFLYLRGRQFLSIGWIAGPALILCTIGFGTYGFQEFDQSSGASFWDAFYKAISLLAIQTGAVQVGTCWQLGLARWCGMIFWGSALITVLLRLFREPVHARLVRWFANNHVIIAGLGQNGSRLVEALKEQKRSVVVIEPDRNHPAVEICRSHGAIVLFGKPDDSDILKGARIEKASTLLALFPEERECVRVAAAAYRMLKGTKTRATRSPLRCVLRLTEPGLLDVVRTHKIKTDSTDQFQLEILNSHEITATTMVREALANSPRGPIRKAMVLGLGTHHRLGEMVVLRLAKDYLINNAGKVNSAKKLIIHVYDEHALEWLGWFQSRYPSIDEICTIRARPCWPRKVGAHKIPEKAYDAAFVCIPEEGHATAQAVMLRREVLTKGQSIMVRVQHSHSGFGNLIGIPKSGWGENIHAIGLEDSLFDPDTATQPELELRAQTIHHAYRATQENREEPANKPWSSLSDTFRKANRKLADHYSEYLAHTDHLKTTPYRLAFQPDGFTRIISNQPLLFQFSDSEVQSLAPREHSRWCKERFDDEWRYGDEKDEIKKTHPLLVAYSKLNEEAKKYNCDIIRDIPRILALADYTIVPVPPCRTNNSHIQSRVLTHTTV